MATALIQSNDATCITIAVSVVRFEINSAPLRADVVESIIFFINLGDMFSASRNSRLMDNASYLASKAVDFDKCGRGDIAICFYQDAATAIYELIRTEEVPESCGSVAEGYEARAVFLKSQLESQRKKIINKTEHQLCLERIEFLLYQALEYDEGNCSDEAISLYTEAVDFCLKSNFSTHTETGRKLRDLMRKALDRAECLKYLSDSQRLLNVISIPTPLVDEISNLKVSNEIMPPSHPASLSHEKSGATNDRLDTEEILVLTATSCINGRKYLPFMNIDLRERFAFPVPFTDRDGHLILSDKQRKHFKLWLRPDQLMESPNVVDMIDSGVIKQTIVSDCSFVASLAISARYEQRFGKRLVTSIIYPQNKDGQPIYNPCGKYMMKLHVNGIWRKVIIDDYFPVGENGQLLCSYNQKKSDIWVSLLEKAYMKVMGGYDFPGSNSSIDMHALTGWIPERIALKSESTSSDAISIFEKLFSRFHHGHCLVTLATGNMGKIDSDRSGLVETHAYAVLDFRKIGDKRLLLLKNPWTHLRWKGKYSDVDRIRWTPELCEALNYDPADARQFDDGIFWIDYDSVCHFFDVFYVNWNPKIFPYSFGLHAMWSAGTSPVKDLYSVAENPQYMLEISNKNGSCAVWILLTRHITEKEDFANNREYITVMIFKSGEKIYSPISPRPIMDPVRINSPHHLSQMVIDEAGTQRYSLVVAQYEKMKTIYYTLKVYSTAKFRLQKIKSPYIYKKQEIGEWKGKTAGGCGNGLSKTTYRDNPIFQLTLGEDSDENDLLVELKGPKEYSVGFEVQLVSSYRGKAFQLRDSGAFRPGYCVLALKSVTGGTYNIQPMTFLHGQEGPFFLNVECSSICTLKRVQ